MHSLLAHTCLILIHYKTFPKLHHCPKPLTLILLPLRTKIPLHCKPSHMLAKHPNFQRSTFKSRISTSLKNPNPKEPASFSPIPNTLQRKPTSFNTQSQSQTSPAVSPKNLFCVTTVPSTL